ncbi:MAG TPA: ABC transporter transmembrane domain-containing protein, partial [Gammaproteobacteria bacterium]|nr:ABC transporter transmembrane domain-containing protein [Gammaproteobacteria bacterium]
MSRKKEDKGVVAAVYRRLLGYVKPYWHGFALAVLGMTIAALTQLGFVWLMKPLMDEAIIAKDPQSIAWIPLFLIGIFVARGIAEFLSTYHMAWVGRHVIKALRREVFDKFLFLPVRFFDSSSSGKLVSQMTYNIEQVAAATTNVVIVMIRDSLTIIFLLGWMLWMNPFLTLFILITVPVLTLLVRLVSRYFQRYSGRIQNSMGDVTQVSEEVIQGQRVVKIFGGEAYESKHFENVNEENRRLHMKLVRVRAGSTPIMQLIA